MHLIAAFLSNSVLNLNRYKKLYLLMLDYFFDSEA
jgi:hypothetical protein